VDPPNPGPMPKPPLLQAPGYSHLAASESMAALLAFASSRAARVAGGSGMARSCHWPSWTHAGIGQSSRNSLSAVPSFAPLSSVLSLSMIETPDCAAFATSERIRK
jgi:hypothetical protein